VAYFTPSNAQVPRCAPNATATIPGSGISDQETLRSTVSVCS
jgi:hypothetical protein